MREKSLRHLLFFLFVYQRIIIWQMQIVIFIALGKIYYIVYNDINVICILVHRFANETALAQRKKFKALVITSSFW